MAVFPTPASPSWVVFGASAEDLNHAFDLVLATDHRIQLAVLRQFSQIEAERPQGGRVDIFLSALLPGLSLAFRRYEVRVNSFKISLRVRAGSTSRLFNT